MNPEYVVQSLESLREMLQLSVVDFAGWYNRMVPRELHITPDKYRRWRRGQSIRVYFVEHAVRRIAWSLNIKYSDLISGDLSRSAAARLHAHLLSNIRGVNRRGSTPSEIPPAHKAFYIYARDPQYPDDARAHLVVVATTEEEVRDLMYEQKPELQIESISPILTVNKIIKL